MVGLHQGHIRRGAQAGGETRRDHDRGGAIMLAQEGQNMVAGGTLGDQRFVAADREQPRVAGAQREGAGDDGLLDPAVAPFRHEGGRGGRCGQGALAGGIIDGAAVVGVDEGEIPVFGALIEVRNARAGDPQHGLAQAVDGTGEGEAAGKGCEFASERPGRVEAGVEEGVAGALVVGVRHGPAGAALAFAQSLFEPAKDTLAEIGEGVGVSGLQIERPGCDQGLIEHDLVGRVGGGTVAAERRAWRRDITLDGAVEANPALERALPFGGYFAEDGEADAAVFAALVVVRGGGQEGVGKRFSRMRLATWKALGERLNWLGSLPTSLRERRRP